jgi:hypothetical protein
LKIFATQELSRRGIPEQSINHDALDPSVAGRTQRDFEALRGACAELVKTTVLIKSMIVFDRRSQLQRAAAPSRSATQLWAERICDAPIC